MYPSVQHFCQWDVKLFAEVSDMNPHAAHKGSQQVQFLIALITFGFETLTYANIDEYLYSSKVPVINTTTFWFGCSSGGGVKGWSLHL